MHVKSIKLINFRNYRGLDIQLNEKLNVFLGNNAQGKTNLLESIYIAAAGRSYRTNKDKELISLDKEQGYIGIEVKKENFNKHIEIKLDKEKSKRVKINKIELDRVADLSGVLNVVIFSPEDLKLIKGGPSERRNFLDSEISQIKPKYRYNISRYNKILYQRNNLLKRMQKNLNKNNVIDVWDIQLAKLGGEIIESRLKFLSDISKVSKKIHNKITGGLEEINLSYLSSFKINGNWKSKELTDAFLKVLKGNLDRDVERGTSEIGPHRDDISVFINGIDTRVFGSQGQQRTAALSLKLAEVELIKDEVREYPVLLLDDVLSELDENRRTFLLSTFREVQTIITSTDDIELDDLLGINKKIFHIKDGNVIEER